MVNKMTAVFPKKFESPRLQLRCYQPGDGKWYYAMRVKNRHHLMQYEADNLAVNIDNEEAAETLVRELAEVWDKHSCFFMGAFNKNTGDTVAQIYVGSIDWHLPEFQIGYFAEVGHEEQGYVTEGVRATLKVLFTQLHAHRLRLACDERNLRSIGVAKRCSMTREAYLRENRRDPDGAYHGSYIYMDDWQVSFWQADARQAFFYFKKDICLLPYSLRIWELARLTYWELIS
jgi:RimJ/RimL family protein N-acetyltransferase